MLQIDEMFPLYTCPNMLVQSACHPPGGSVTDRTHADGPDLNLKSFFSAFDPHFYSCPATSLAVIILLPGGSADRGISKWR